MVHGHLMLTSASRNPRCESEPSPRWASRALTHRTGEEPHMSSLEAGRNVLVAGAGGFIGGHLVRALIEDGHQVRAVDCKPLTDWYQGAGEAESVVGDLSALEACHRAAEGMSVVYNLAADMGGMGFIENNKALCMLSV